MSWLSEFVRRTLNSEMRADQVQAAEPKAPENCGKGWRDLIETLKIDASGAGATGDQCSVGVSCKNGSTDLFSDMLISTDVDQQKMLMARRMQAAVRLSIAEHKRKSALTGLVTVIVNNSRSHS